ncbi:unnamed protein product [Coregonus sp. 'balchen']|nr:unnamed protein product [Coregonus sp. 'balchen']
MRNLKKIERTYQREKEEGHKIIHIVLTTHITRAEREREKRKELLKDEEIRKKLEDYNKQWRAQSLLRKQHQRKEERERMKEQSLNEKQEKWLEQMNLEADAQIKKCSTQYITRCPTKSLSQEPVGSGDGQQERPRRPQAWAENQQGGGRDPADRGSRRG